MPSDRVIELVRISAFGLHALMACIVAGLLFGCRTQLYTNSGYRTVALDWQDWRNRTGLQTCTSIQQCNRMAIPWAEDEILVRHRWNPYATVMTFEVISASFALFYLRELPRVPRWFQLVAQYAPLGWNFAGFMVYLVWYSVRGQDNWCEPLAIAVSYGLAGVLLFWHDRWRAEFEERALHGFAALLARRFYRCYVSGFPWRIPLKAEPGGEEVLDTNGFPSQQEMTLILRRRLAVMLRYGEYTITASLLYLAVLSIFVVGPPSWAFVAGFTGIFACNASGLALHLLHTEMAVGEAISDLVIARAERDQPGQARPAARQCARWQSPFLRVPVLASVARPGLGAPPGAQPIPDEPDEAPPARPDRRWHQVAAAVLGVGTWHEHWVSKLALLEAAWFGLMVGISIVLYFGRGYLFNTNLPGFVVFVLWNLIVQYSAFGIAGTVFYAYDRQWVWMEQVLDVLSLAAKVPIAMSVCVAFLQMPGGSC